MLTNTLLRVGMEIEVAQWDGRTYQEVCADLVEADYMYGPVELWNNHHTYHCNCREGGCNLVRKGTQLDKPIVSMTYDGSLPKTGAEFIVSPILFDVQDQIDRLREIWEIVTNRAVWVDTLRNYHNDGYASPSIHLHVSAANMDNPDVHKVMNSEYSNSRYFGEDILHGLSLFTPELFLLADLAGVRRGLKYRLPSRESIARDQIHHGFIQVKQATPGAYVYLEWRLFEAAYNDWPYVESAAHVSSVLTRGFLNGESISRLLAVGYSHTFDEAKIMTAVDSNDTSTLLSMVNADRLDALHELCINDIESPRTLYMINDIFAKAELKL